MCIICKIRQYRGRKINAAYPAYQLLDGSGAPTKLQALCRDIALDYVRQGFGASIRLEPRQNEADVPPDLRAVYDAVYAVDATL